MKIEVRKTQHLLIKGCHTKLIVHGCKVRILLSFVGVVFVPETGVRGTVVAIPLFLSFVAVLRRERVQH